MTQTTAMRLRGWWFSVHKWLGLCLALLIVPVSLTGSALVWHDWLDETLNPQRYAVAGEAGLTPTAYAAAARAALGPEERVASIRWPEGEGPVTVVAARPPQPGATRPARTNVWLDPASGRVLDSASADAGPVRVMHVLHGSLMVPGWGRTDRRLGRRLHVRLLPHRHLAVVADRRQREARLPLEAAEFDQRQHPPSGRLLGAAAAGDAELHRLLDLLPEPVRHVRGEPAQGQGQGQERAWRRPRPRGARPPARADGDERRRRRWPLRARTPPGGWSRSPGRPTRPANGRSPSPAPGGAAEVEIDDASGEVTPPRPPRPETRARLMRRLHDGTGMGLGWQILIFLGGIIPAILSVTGIVMWLRSRGWRAQLARKRKAGRLAPAPQPAE